MENKEQTNSKTPKVCKGDIHFLKFLDTAKIKRMKKFKLVSISFIISAVFFLAINALAAGLEDVWFWQEMAHNPKMLAAQAAEEEMMLRKFKHQKESKAKEVSSLDLDAKSAMGVYLGRDSGQESPRKFFYKKNIRQKLPIASLTKLVTALVVLENYDLARTVKISKKAIAQDESFGQLTVGEELLAGDLLYSFLIESSNDAAYALAEVIGVDAFVELMNLTAKDKVELSNTHFINPTGLDPESIKDPGNHSTAEDLVKLAAYLLDNHRLIWDILATPTMDIYNADGSFHHHVVTTNQLFGRVPGLIGSKTGYTEFAGGCLVMVLENPRIKGYMVNVILGSDDRFGDMQELIQRINEVYYDTGHNN